jgi:hypothetical protein
LWAISILPMSARERRDLALRLWFFHAFGSIGLPLPLYWNRLALPLCVFSFGIKSPFNPLDGTIKGRASHDCPGIKRRLRGCALHASQKSAQQATAPPVRAASTAAC